MHGGAGLWVYGLRGVREGVINQEGSGAGASTAVACKGAKNRIRGVCPMLKSISLSLACVVACSGLVGIWNWP